MFNDLPRDSNGKLSSDPAVGYANQGMFGKILSRVDSSGFTTVYSYDNEGFVTVVVRSDGVTGESDKITYTYTTVSNSLGGSAKLLSSATLWRKDTSSSPFDVVRSASYSYYSGVGSDSDHGRLGDLKLVNIHDGDVNSGVIEQKYYRYYKQWAQSRKGEPGRQTTSTQWRNGCDIHSLYNSMERPYYTTFQPADNAVLSGLKSVVEGAAFSRLIAANPNYTSASDQVIATNCCKSKLHFGKRSSDRDLCR